MRLSLLTPVVLLAAAAVLAPAFAPAFAQAPSYARERARIDSLVTAEVSGGPIAAVSVAVMKGKDTLVMKAWGLSDVENGVIATPASVFRIGSITKQFTSAAIMQLVEKGQLSLDDSIGALLPRMPAAWTGVTLRELLNHTSGIPSYTNLGESWRKRWGEEMLPDTIVGLVVRDTMDFAPGTKWSYDNTGYVLLGMILDRKTGKPYPRYLDEQLFKPLGLGATEYCFTRTIIRNRAQGYERSGSQFMNAEYLAMTQPYSAGALCSTVGDLVKWTAALHSGRVVSPASLKTMTTPVGAAAKSHYGFGLVTDTVAGHTRISHSGGINGFLSNLAYYPADTLTIAVLANTIPSTPDFIAGNIARIIFGQPLTGVTPARVTLAASDLGRYVGDYGLALPDGHTMVLHVTLAGDKLMARAEGQGGFDLIPYGQDAFGAAFDRTLRLTFTLAEGRAAKVVLHQGETDIEGVRR